MLRAHEVPWTCTACVTSNRRLPIPCVRPAFVTCTSRKSTGDLGEMLMCATSVVGLTYCVAVTAIVVSTTPPCSQAACAPGANPLPVIVTTSPVWPCLPNDGLVAVTVTPVDFA